MFILNLKGIAASLWTVRLHIQMYRNAVDVLESFGSIRPGHKPPPPRTEDLRASHVPVLQERPSPSDTLIPQDNFCKDMSLHWAETF